ncbi:cytochrome c [Enhydrobacter aerosaccus]|uniref:Cytochrome c n=1 Tax=Enhydrobacter aerosaccus TaxID=225324 RepID=A0A1T4THF0_9HYPH|nr:c-type cytochrome [Enhydrobacter aerosaccus]SKA39896.1 cytochrome c [Enhydrobacter aerosaccus]
MTGRILTTLLAALVASLLATNASAAEGNAAAGQRVFGRCAACHSAEPGKNGIGPSLSDVFGRKSGTVEGYDYSPSLKSAGITWDSATLDRFLLSPDGLVHGTKMFMTLTNERDRSNVIAYLKTLHP